MIKLSVVVPIYGDAEQAEPFCAEFKKIMEGYWQAPDLKGTVELIFVHDGSGAAQFEILRALLEKYNFVALIDLSRNFGQHIALSCGFSAAQGEYVATLDVDRQDPLEELPKLLSEITRLQVDVVRGLRKERQDTFLKTQLSRLFHGLFNRLTGYEIPINIAVMRVMNRRFVDAYNRLSEKSRYIPGLEMWLGFRHAYLEIDHQSRKMGRSSYSMKKRLILALDSIISFSDLPLRICVVVGAGITALGFLATLILIFFKLFSTRFLPGYVSLVSLLVFIGGIQILFTGLLCLYVGRILKEVQNRPLFLVRESINISVDV